MPELPEVEIQARQLSARLRGAIIRRVEVRDPKLRLPGTIARRAIARIWRRGKYIVFDFDDGRHLLAHLRMTGWFEFDRPARYRIALVTSRGTVYFTDNRRLGVLRIVSSRVLADILGPLGPDPLTDGWNLARLNGTSRPVKVALLDQRLVAGIGNIYASE